MAHALGDLFTTPTLISGTVYALSSTASAAASNTKASVQGAGVSTPRQFVPEGTANANAVPAAPATLSNIGWRLTPIIALSDPGTLAAGSATVPIVLNFTQALGGQPSTVTGILFLGGTELARAAASVVAAAGDNTYSLAMSWPQTAIASGAALDLEVYFTGPLLNSALTATTITLKYTTAGTKVGAGLDYTIQAARTVTDTRATSDAVTRVFTGARGTTETLTTSDSPARVASHPRGVTETLTTSDAVARVVAHPRSITETLTTSDAVVRAYTGTRSVTETLTTSDTTTRALIYGRFITENIGPSGGGGTTIIKKNYTYIFD